MPKRIVIADYDINVASIQKKIDEIKASLDNPDLGKGFSTKFNNQLQKIEQSLLKVSESTPGSGATSKQIENYNKKLLSIKNNLSNFISGLKGFEFSDKYILKNIESLQEYINKLEDASNKLKEIKENTPTEYRASAEGMVRRVEDVQKDMKNAAQKGDRQGVINAYRQFSDNMAADRRKVKNTDPEQYAALGKDRDEVHQKEKEYIKLAERVIKLDQERLALQQQLNQVMGEAKNKATIAVSGTVNITDNTISQVEKVRSEVNAFSKDTKELENSSDAFDTVSHKISNLFSAASVFHLISRVVRGAIQDFKELDKQFNEIAIVSEYSTKEMWKSFSTVNKTAQEFGVTTKNVLEVQNLYYHQGKSMAEVNKLTAQTLTLAKITGMDYERATSDLTAALNAYNIAAEDAVRVTDTIAAMDTNAAISSEELMTALTKTASIAANAGMSLESTEVFLTKMIETTREAPENLGTALKTIIARFGEVKQEIDGEEIELADINRVDTALKSIGISLLDTAGQIRDLDGVFMELSSKWDDLDRNTQRYIATIAAGSRQQSRFIAMMEDYDRTLELTEIAQNSAGLGAKQLAKSQESIETSINRLKSTWQEFYSNVLTSDMIKVPLDTLNKILSVLNKLPGPMGAITAAVATWALKTKVLNKVLATHKIINQGIREGLTQEQIIYKLSTANKRAEKQTLKEYIAILQAYRAAKNGANAEDAKDAADPTTLLAQLAENEALDQNTKEILKNTSVKIAADTADKNAAIELATETLNQIAANEALEENTRDLAKNTVELIKNTSAKTANAGASTAQTATETANNTSKKGGILNTLSSFLSNPKVLAIIIAIGAAIAAVTVVYKKFIKASTDDTKQLEKLQKARDKYNKTLNEYKSSVENLEIVEKHANKTFKTAEETEEEQTAIKELVTLYPYLLEKIDDEGNYHIKNTDAIRAEINAKKELLNEDIKANNLLRAQQAREGIYADESTRAGQAMSRMVDYYSVLDEDALDRVAESIDRLGDFNTTLFKEFAEAYASGEKTSFSYKDMSNLFGHGMYLNEAQFNSLVESYNKNLSDEMSIEDAFRSALTTVGLNDERLVDMWAQLNKQTGNVYSDLLSGIGEEVNEIYVAEAEVFLEGEMKDTDANERVLNALEKAYARTKIGEIEDLKAIRERKIEEEAEATKNTYVTVSPTDPNYATELAKAEAKAYRDAWIRNMIFTSDKKIEEEATRNAEEKSKNLTNELKQGDNIKNVNKIFDNFGAEQFKVGKTDFGFKTRVEVIDQFLNEEFALQQKELDDIYNKIVKTRQDFKEFDGTTFAWDWEKILPSNDQMLAINEKFTQLGDWGGNKFLEGWQTAIQGSEGLTTEIQGKIKNLYLNIDPTNINSIGEALFEMERLGMSTEDTQAAFQKLVDSAGGLDGYNLGDLTTSAEKAEKAIDNLEKSIEGLMNLVSGSGTVSDVAKLFDNIAKLAEEKGEDVQQALNTAKSQISYTSEGIQYGGSDSVAAAERMVELQQTILMYEMQLLQTEIAELEAKEALTDAELSLLNAKYTQQEFNKVLWGEYDASFQRALNDANTKKLEDQLEKLERIRDAIKDIVTWLREYDKYADLDAVITDLQNDYGHLEFEIEFSTNSDVIAEDIQETISNLNTQIAANQGGLAAAKSNQAMYRDVLEKQNGNYISFDAKGNVIADQEALYQLQKKIANAKKAGQEGTAEALQNEYEQIIANIEAYREEKDKVEAYSKALEENFKQMEEFLKANYDSITKVEDKLIEARMAAEDKHLEAVKEKYEAIKDENDKYLKDIQEMINKEREIRDRADREQDVKDKEKKLAMMKMDTSGIYASDIRALEKELEGDYRDLEDDAVDKAITVLEKEYQTQSEILDKEVEYLESSLEYRREIMTEYNQWAQELMMQGSDTVLEYLKANDEEYYTGTAAAQASWVLEWEGAVAQGVAANQAMKTSLDPLLNALLSCQRNAEGFEGAVEQYSETAIANNGEVSASVEDLTGYYTNLVDEVGDLNGALDTLNSAYWNAAAAADALADAQQRVLNTKPYGGTIDTVDNNNKNLLPTQDTDGSDARKVVAGGWGITNDANTTTWKTTSGRKLMYGNEAYYEVTNDSGVKHWVVHYQLNDTKTRAKMGAELWDFSEEYYQKYKFAKGGYVDYTGPAWVDGTKSHPEYMLNATQTAQFEALVAALSNLYGNGISSLKQSSQKIGDAYYNFHINVEQMASDYDVDQLVSRLEQKMVDSSKYRNITLLKKS